MRIIKVTNVEQFAAKILPKQPQNNKTIVESILKDVKKNGDAAIRKYEKKFSKANISSLRLTPSEIKNAYSKISKSELGALRLAKDRLEKTESIVKSLLKNKTINHDGTKISKKFIPIQSVGCYIPGGLAKYPSSAIMSIVQPKLRELKES
jgi:histidinol dehydrogenase